MQNSSMCTRKGCGTEQLPRHPQRGRCMLAIVLLVCGHGLLPVPAKALHLAFVPTSLPSRNCRSRSVCLPLNAFKFRVVTFSKTKEKWCETACEDYGKRVRKFGVGLEEVVLKPAPGPPKRTVEQQREEEGLDLLSRLDPGRESLVVLDERGEMLTSHQFADFLQKCADDGVQAVTFAIGGANGHSKEVQQTAKQNGKMISFGKMVMNHQVARVVLFEQLYRALTIQRGVPYHK